MRCLLLALGLLGLLNTAAAAETPVTVFAAASLKGALGQVSAAWAAHGHPPLSVALDSSGTLAKQIAQGAPAQIFFSADQKWMDYLASRKLVITATRKNLLTNTLVLVAPASSAKPVTIGPKLDLPSLLGPQGRLAIGEPGTVPAGIYGKQALTTLGLWESVKTRLAPAANVRAALLLVETGEAPAGIVYGTDARGDAKIGVIGTFPDSSHDPITYPVALVQPGADAASALAFIEGPEAQTIFRKAGFGVP